MSNQNRRLSLEGSISINHYKPNTTPRFKPYQLDILEKFYSKSTNPTIEERNELAHQTGTESKRITVWFQNRRSKEHKLRRKSGSQPSVEASVEKQALYLSSSNKPISDASEHEAKLVDDAIYSSSAPATLVHVENSPFSNLSFTNNYRLHQLEFDETTFEIRKNHKSSDPWNYKLN